MTLTLHYHPLSSYSHKVLIALYEAGAAFTPAVVNFGDPAAAAKFFALWPLGKIPVLEDKGRVLPESTVIIEYLAQVHPGRATLLPTGESQLEARLLDRVFDLHVQTPMQKIVGDRLRPEGEKDPRGVADARKALHTVYGWLEQRLNGRAWAAGDSFTLADCAAAPALFYAGILAPFAGDFPIVTAYFERLVARPSVARVLKEARPFFDYFPFKDEIPARFLTA